MRDVSLEKFEARARELNGLIRRRARHVVTENERTLQAVMAMKHNNPVLLGKLMNASHQSLRDDFEVSSPELDIMVNCALEHDSCFGARMTGAGFGGCPVALVRADAAESVLSNVTKCYRQSNGKTPRIYLCNSADGADGEEVI